jgi:hypothetical protein
MSIDFLNYCSFCGNVGDDNNKLVIGPELSICGSCASIAADVAGELGTERYVPLSTDDLDLIIQTFGYRVSSLSPDDPRNEPEIKRCSQLRKKLRKYRSIKR